MPSPSSNSSTSSSEEDTPKRHAAATAAAATAAAAALDHSDFSANEDGAILKLKASGATWAAIGASVGRPKADVRERHRALGLFYDQMGTDADRIGEGWARKWRADGNEVPSPERPLRLRGHRSGGSHSGDRKEKDKSHGGDKGGKDKKRHGPPKTPTNPKPAKEVGGTRDRKKASAAVLSSSSSSSSEEPSSSSSSEDSTDSEEERASQRRHIYHHLYGDLYPNRRTLEPDEFWSEDDCKVLATVEAKHDELRWKYIQAGFFNATGRMVSAELIKHKMGAKEN